MRLTLFDTFHSRRATMTRFTMTNEQADAELDSICNNGNIPPHVKATVGVAAKVGGGVLSGIRVGLRNAGFSPLAIISLITEIFSLIQEYGPEAADLVAKVVARLREIFNK